MGVHRAQVALTYLPEPDFLEFEPTSTHLTVVTNDGSDLTKQVIKELKGKGHQVLALNLPHHLGNRIRHKVTTLKEVSNEAIRDTIQSIEAKHGKIGTFIHIHPQLKLQGHNIGEHVELDQSIVKTVFLFAKHLQARLVPVGQQERAQFMCITQVDGQLGLGQQHKASPVGGGLSGLVKSLNLEWPSVSCRLLDLDPTIPVDQQASFVYQELHDPNRSVTEVGRTQTKRQTLGTIPTPLNASALIETTINSDSVFLVSGGARGVTATCVIDMAKAFQCKFILLGRSSNEGNIPAFAQGDLDESTLKRLLMEDLKNKGEKPSLGKVKSLYKTIVAKKEIDQTLQAIQQHGGQAIYLQVDVTKASEVKEKVAALPAPFHSITGIIHGAGRLADKFIQDKTEQDFENVLAVKIDGLLALLQSVDIKQLKHLFLFSSVAGFYGNIGQTDYSIANEILSKSAHLLKSLYPKLHVSAINWGAWDGGMVSPALKKQFEAAGVSLVNSQGGAAMLVNEFNLAYANQPQAVIGDTLVPLSSHLDKPLQTHRIQRVLTEAANPFLNHHVIQGNAVLPVVNAVGWMAQMGEQLYPDFRVFQVENTRLFKGIVFDGKQVKDYILELKETEKSSDQIRLEATVLSEGKKLPTYHYKATITLIPTKNKVTLPSFQANLSGTYQATEGAILYQDGSLFHDTFFRGIESVLDWTEEQIILTCRAPKVPLDAQGQFPVQSVNTYFADIQYQGMVIWVQRYHEGALSLPLQTQSATIYKPVPFDQELFVHVQITENSDFRIVANCTVYDENGQVYMFTEGAIVTISKQLKW